MPDINPAWIAATLVIIASWVGVVLTLITLPGLWLAVIAGAAAAFWDSTFLSWWYVGAALAVAIIAEVLEFMAGAMGARKGGSSKKGAVGALIGSIVGAIAGSPIIFPIGTIVGAVLGAAVGTMIIERGSQGKTWAETTRAGKGAAMGRLAATLIKTVLAGVIAIILTIGVLI
ncbi:MAG TPA: DUF456 domain-containing protein [Phycisphaerales bacterium]|nr:DUF456 domain-containing protein [Phycisphaerales bacterium]